ncbi:MAG: FkbM family methyltransferase [Sphingobacteriales bacterium]|nr:MAG: FkbM family methyltransferase [Sphingobacteriales bacterium]
MNQPLIEQLSAFASGSKLKRLLHHPSKYLTFLWKSKLLPLTGLRKSSLETAVTFWGEPMTVSLPSSSDIFLAGGKTHDSEIRLAQWLIANIRHYQAFVDIGAHVGYFSLLTAHFSDAALKIQSFEPARSAFALLQKNTANHTRITVQQAAIGTVAGEATFHEFPHEYAEYSSLVLDNYTEELKRTLQQTSIDYTVPVKTLRDLLVSTHDSTAGKTLIKIDTEGNELAVLQGAGPLLQTADCDFVIEFLSNGNETYDQAEQLLRKAGYKGFLLNSKGLPEAHPSAVAAMKAQGLESENVLFRK